MKTLFKIGTRGSPLALYQAELVKALIAENYPMYQVEIVKIRTSGDMTRRANPSPLETKRVFTKEIEEALLSQDVDIAVHSAKDLSVNLPEGTILGATLTREDPRDCLVSEKYASLEEIPQEGLIGTSSLRRKMQLLRLRPDLNVQEIHGNVQTRIRKMKEGQFDGILLAYAGMKRLGLVNDITQAFEEVEFLPAPGQGVILAQIHDGDAETGALLKNLSDVVTQQRLDCERSFLRRLEGGCQLPCGIRTVVDDEKIFAEGILFATDELKWIQQDIEGPAEDAAELGFALANKILDQGGNDILKSLHRDFKRS